MITKYVANHIFAVFTNVILLYSTFFLSEITEVKMNAEKNYRDGKQMDLDDRQQYFIFTDTVTVLTLH